MHEELLEWAIAAYLADAHADGETIAGVLAAHGFSLRSARRATALLPLAFGRRVLQTLVSLPEKLREIDASGKAVYDGPLSGDAMYAAAAERASRASRAEVERIGLVSTEVDVVNQALHRGSRAEDLVLSGPVLVADVRSPRDEVDASPVSTTRVRVAELLAAHGSKLTIDARLFPRKLTAESAQLQIDFLVAAPILGDRRVCESFAGMGKTIEDALGDALKKLAVGSLHVAMAALEDERLGGEHVQWEAWGPFRACVGPLLRQWSTMMLVDFAAYFDALKARLLVASLAPTVHWYRTFVAVGEEIYGFDALLDNETWAPGADLVQAWPWPRAEDAYALRSFLVLVPAARD
jgi:hypothetical protein